MSKRYNNRVLTRPPRPRSKRLREAGASASGISVIYNQGSGSGSSSGGGGGGGGTGTVTSVALSAPTGFAVGGSPVTAAGTLQLSFASGYSLPLTADVQKGVDAYGWGNHADAGYQPAISDLATIRNHAGKGSTAYSWGNHAGEGYLKAINYNMVVNALGYTPADSTKGLQRPQIRIVRGLTMFDTYTVEPTLVASHPLVGPDGPADACMVLMVYRKRRGRWSPASSRYVYYKDKWGEARGQLATNAALTFIDRVLLGDLSQHILRNYICIKGAALPTTMTLAQFRTAGKARFGRLKNFSGTADAFKAKTHGSRLFGIAVRYTNPEFTELVVEGRTLAETTRSIGDVPRYIYSDIVPIRVTVGADNHGNHIGFQLGVGMV